MINFKGFFLMIPFPLLCCCWLLTTTAGFTRSSTATSTTRLSAMDRRGMFATTATSFLIARPPNYDKYASSYDSTSSPSSPLPTLLGISKLRASLISTYAYGDVIEVGGGTGGNLVGGYDFGGVDSVTLTDVSSEMMKIAKMKVEGVLENASRKISFAELNILDPVGEKFLGRFDTVVCTFVLCV